MMIPNKHWFIKWLFLFYFFLCLRLQRRVALTVRLAAFLMFLYTGQEFLHIVRGPQDHGHPLVDALWLYIQHWLSPSGGHPSSLFDDERDRVALIQEPELRVTTQEQHSLSLQCSDFNRIPFHLSQQKCWNSLHIEILEG